MTEEQWATIVALVDAYADACCGCSTTNAVPEQAREMFERAAAALPQFTSTYDVVKYAKNFPS